MGWEEKVIEQNEEVEVVELEYAERMGEIVVYTRPFE